MKNIGLLIFLAAIASASTYESGLAFTCVYQAKLIGIESNTGTMDFCKPCTAEKFQVEGKRVDEQAIEGLCHDAVLLYIEQQNKNLPKQ